MQNNRIRGLKFKSLMDYLYWIIFVSGIHYNRLKLWALYAGCFNGLTTDEKLTS